jgi:glycosyltransferase involved in cell wall biosynthesis
MQQLSVVIITFNEEKNIERCLRSVVGIADEIIVVDSFSTDNTETICRGFEKLKFYKHSFLGYIEQKNKALEFASNPYVLSLDADEALSEELQQSILKAKEAWSYDGYRFNRLNNYCGIWIRHTDWYPDRKLRIFDKRKGTWAGDNPHDQYILPHGSKIGYLKGVILHYSYDSISQHIIQQNKFSNIAAQVLFERGKNVSILGIVSKPMWTFFRNFFIKLGFLDGFYGFLVCSVSAFYTFMKYVKLYHLHRKAYFEKKQAMRFAYNPNVRVSLIISTYNRIDVLKLVLKSALRQSVYPCEIVVADDGSTEETKQLVDYYASVSPVPIIHCWHEDLGFRLAHIRNKAIAISRGNYIVSIDGDVVMHKHFIKDHIDHARAGYFIQGSRVLLLQEKTNDFIRKERLDLFLYSTGISNRKNTVRNPILARLFSSHSSKNVRGTRGCNMSFWKSDLIKVNGFNEEFVGWGREDSDIVVRLHNAGVSRLKLKFSGLVFHLFHPENRNNEQLNHNDIVLQQSIDNKISRCENGIDKYL